MHDVNEQAPPSIASWSVFRLRRYLSAQRLFCTISRTNMSNAIPKNMRAVVLEEYHDTATAAIGSLKVRERPVQQPRHGQVLVRIEAAPCNPSDLLLLQGKYGTLKKLPTVPGWEGAGTVVASGGGLYGWWLMGKRVACALRSSNRDGTWAEYFVANASDCIPLKAAVPIEQAASFIINPMTAVALLETATRAGHHAAVHTAGREPVGPDDARNRGRHEISADQPGSPRRAGRVTQIARRRARHQYVARRICGRAENAAAQH